MAPENRDRKSNFLNPGKNQFDRIFKRNEFLNQLLVKITIVLQPFYSYCDKASFCMTKELMLFQSHYEKATKRIKTQNNLF